jgi:ATP-dependent Clp protease adaptor protein ClpS
MKQKELELPSTSADSQQQKSSCVLVLCNDDLNTFNFVIEALVDVCDHDLLQAEQCAMITHYNGSCDIKIGDFDYLVSLKRRLLGMGLTAVVENI